MRTAPTRLTCGTMVISSSVRPELDSAMNTSCAVTMPRSPWLASAGCTKKAGVPVEASVAAILRAMCPDLPMPLTMTRPWQASTWRQARQKPSSSVSRRCCTASASMASTWRARSSRALSSIWAGGWEVMRGQGNETGGGLPTVVFQYRASDGVWGPTAAVRFHERHLVTCSVRGGPPMSCGACAVKSAPCGRTAVTSLRDTRQERGAGRWGRVSQGMTSGLY